MNKKITLPASDDLDEAPIWTDDDFKNAVHRAGLKPLPYIMDQVQNQESRIFTATNYSPYCILQLKMLPHFLLAVYPLRKQQ
ncbi:MAG: hypothetical protein Q8K59_11890 [Nitrosomonas sp.]|nr:hypothetical protein [Nitrosomonas sp.]